MVQAITAIQSITFGFSGYQPPAVRSRTNTDLRGLRLSQIIGPNIRARLRPFSRRCPAKTTQLHLPDGLRPLRLVCPHNTPESTGHGSGDTLVISVGDRLRLMWVRLWLRRSQQGHLEGGQIFVPKGLNALPWNLRPERTDEAGCICASGSRSWEDEGRARPCG